MDESKMPWFSQMRCGHVALVTAVTTSGWMVAPRPANAANGSLPSSVSGCSSNFHIGTYSSNRIKTTNPDNKTVTDYGWWEWRYSNTGSCRGYQWVRLHIEHNLAISVEDGGYLKTDYWRTDNSSTQYYFTITPSIFKQYVQFGADLALTSIFKPGTFNGRLLYSPNSKACSTFHTDALVVGFNLAQSTILQGYICA
jgi:hypothetical protein